MATAQSIQSLASPAIKALIRRRLTELGSLALGLAAIAFLLALASYDPRDPSLNTASGAIPHNLAGPAGALLADLLLQSFGLAAILPGLAMLAWAWRVASRLGLGRLGPRLVGISIAVPAFSAVLGAVTASTTNLAWPVMAGPGGAIGRLIGGTVIAAGDGLLGPLGLLLGWAMLVVLAGISGWLALGLSQGEWQVAGRGAADAARFSVHHGWNAIGFARRLIRFPAKAAEPEPIAKLLANLDAVEDEAEADIQVRREPRLDAAAPPPRPRVAPRRAAPPPRQESLPLEDGFRFPSLSLLKPAPARATTGPSAESLQANARLLESVLGDYGVQGAIVEIRPGPVVTLYELEPAPGIRSARVIGLADDIARSLSVTAVRIATVPGRNVIGIEVPNSRRETVYLSELLATDDWVKHPARLALALGKDISGAPVAADLARMPHLLIAGTTGSGKSVGVNAMILSLLYRMPPDQCRLILIDPKMLELSVYEGIPHLMAPVVTEPKKAVTALKWTVREMERRYRSMSQVGVRNIGGYNERVAAARAKGEVVTRRVQTGFDAETGRPMFEEQPLVLEPLPFIVVVIDEMADLMMVAGKDIEAAVQRLAQMARAAGIHVIMATQRPSVDVITGTIKANFPTRISFQVISKFDSRTILGEQGSEQLLGQGDMLYMMGGGRITRVHGPFVSDAEVEAVVEYLREQGEPAYIEEITEAEEDDNSGPAIPGMGEGGSEGERGLYEQAVSLVAREGKASTSFIQRHLQIGYNRAARLIEQMEKDGVVSPANHVGKREVLLGGRAEA
ncbi:MAG TPA: DNA translocase FtsK 4TM domain-containing protein [Acetobacteraceae bacterium]|nr:DNA translocase FtsK 4TM domain-containing protein [Acetobacteraceae bacterium]